MSIQPKCIIYDWNGTLLNDVDLCYDLLLVLLDKYGLPRISMDRYKEVFTFPIIDYYRAVGFNFDIDSYEYMADQLYIPMYNARRHEATLAEGVPTLLEKAKDLKITQIIISASEQSLLERQVAHYSLREYFVALYGSRDNYASSKVDMAREFLREHDYTASDVIMIGDTIHDYEIAREIGCECILVASGHQSFERLATTGATVVDDMTRIIDML